MKKLDQLGNLITVQPANTALGQPTELPTTAEGMVSRIAPVTHVTEIASIQNTYVYRSSFVPERRARRSADRLHRRRDGHLGWAIRPQPRSTTERSGVDGEPPAFVTAEVHDGQ